MSKNKEAEGAARLIGALLRMPPKPHSEMKLGTKRGSASAEPRRRSDQAVKQKRERQKAPR
jgi:hypothetical protein